MADTSDSDSTGPHDYEPGDPNVLERGEGRIGLPPRPGDGSIPLPPPPQARVHYIQPDIPSRERTKRTRSYSYGNAPRRDFEKARPHVHEVRPNLGPDISINDFIYEKKDSKRKSQRRSSSSKRKKQHGDDDIYNEFYGGGSFSPPDPWADPGRPSQYGREDYNRFGRPQMHESMMPDPLSMPSMPRPVQNVYAPDPVTWSRASKPGIEKVEQVTVQPILLFMRRGNMCKSRTFTYTRTKTKDIELATKIRDRYKSMKGSQIGYLQKVFAYKTIAFVFVLQGVWRPVDPDDPEELGHWDVKRWPITTDFDQKGREAFMHRYRNILRNRDSGGAPRMWCTTIDKSIPIIGKTKIDLEISETFDTSKLYWGVLMSVVLSLATALLYGFFMNNDFATGFSIGSWMITAFAFLAAVVAAGEFLGLESPISFVGASELETEQAAREFWNAKNNRSRLSGYR